LSDIWVYDEKTLRGDGKSGITRRELNESDAAALRALEATRPWITGGEKIIIRA
jgi:hypothetical protein